VHYKAGARKKGTTIVAPNYLGMTLVALDICQKLFPDALSANRQLINGL